MKFEEMSIEKELDVNRLQTAISATDEEASQWLGSLLADYDIEPTRENIEVAARLIRTWLEELASVHGVRLTKDELSTLFRFTIRLAYEALYVGTT